MSLLPNQHPYVLAQLLNEGIYCVDDRPSIVQNTTQALTEAEKPREKPVENGIPDYLGENNRFILILAHHAGRQYLPDEEKAFLLSVLKAIKLDIADVAIVNHANYPQSGFEELKTFFACASVLLFGVKPESLGLSGTKYESNKIGDCKLIAAHSLKEIMDDKDKKKLLWATLKSNFNV